jgi:hypothetical protein
VKRTMRLVVVFLLGLALGIGGTLGIHAVTDESTPSRSEVREGLAEEWGELYAECVEEAETPADDYFEEDDSTPSGGACPRSRSNSPGTLNSRRSARLREAHSPSSALSRLPPA